MINNSELKVYDGDYEIIYSNTFNFFDKIKIGKIGGYDLAFIFKKSKVGNTIEFSRFGEDAVDIVVTYTGSPSGLSTTKRIKIMDFSKEGTEKSLFFSLYRHGGDDIDIGTVTITLYVK